MPDTRVPLSSIAFDPNNANVHTDDGHDLLQHSLSTFGFAEAGVLDRDNQLIGGEHRTRVATELGMTSARIIDHDPADGPIYIRLPSFDLDSPDPDIRRRSNELSVMLNRAAQRSIRINPLILEANAHLFGFDTSTYFTDEELANLKLEWNAQFDTSDGIDFEDYEAPSTASLIAYRVVVDGLELSAAEELAASVPNSRVEQYREKPA